VSVQFFNYVHEYRGDTDFVCLEGYALAGQQFNFRVFFITQL